MGRAIRRAYKARSVRILKRNTANSSSGATIDRRRGRGEDGVTPVPALAQSRHRPEERRRWSGVAAVKEAAAAQTEEQRREAEAGRGNVRLRPGELLPELRRWHRLRPPLFKLGRASHLVLVLYF